MDDLKKLIREVPDWPKPGILFYDLTTLLKDKTGFAALIGLFMFSVPTFLAYFVAAALIERKPENLYLSGPEEEFWRSVRTEPRQTVGELRHKFREIERRLRAMEGWITSREFKLNREFRDLDR